MPGKDSVPTSQTGNGNADTKSNDPKAASQPQEANAFSAHRAHPGPVISQSLPEQEGTKEERLAKAKELNK